MTIVNALWREHGLMRTMIYDVDIVTLSAFAADPSIGLPVGQTLLGEGAAAEGHVTAHPAGDFVHAVMAEVTRVVSGSTIRRMCNSRGPEPFDKHME